MITSHQLRDLVDGRPFGIRALDDGAFARVSPLTSKLATDAGSMTIVSVISTSDRDRAGDVIVPAGTAQRRRVHEEPRRAVGA